MATYRRDFLAHGGLAMAALGIPGRAWSAPVGEPGPVPNLPPQSAQGSVAVAQSPVLADLERARQAVDAALSAGARYADARLARSRSQFIEVRDGEVHEVSHTDSYGIGVRAVADGGWGVAAAPTVERSSPSAVARLAVDMATRNGRMRRELNMPAARRVANFGRTGSWVSPHVVDPFAVPLVEKSDLLRAASEALRGVRGVLHASAGVLVTGEDRILVTSDGGQMHQIAFWVAPQLRATAVSRRLGRSRSRSLDVGPAQAGWEYVAEVDVLSIAPRISRDALRTLHAPAVAPGPRHVIVAPSNLWKTLRESLGRQTRVRPAPGTGSLVDEAQGEPQVAAAGVSLVADRTQPCGLATAQWDDDGVPTGRWDVVRDGEWVGAQVRHDPGGWHEEVERQGLRRGQGYAGVALPRMPNLSLQPGAEGYTTEDLINATDDGVLILGLGDAWLDAAGDRFAFSGQMCWEIKRGRLTRPLRDVAYQADTEAFWRSCDMLGGSGTYRLGGLLHDPHWHPGTHRAVSYGCPCARFQADVVPAGSSR